MARNRDGHADLDDIYDRLGNRAAPTSVRLLELMLAELLRSKALPVPTGEESWYCVRGAGRVHATLYESQPRPTHCPCGMLLSRGHDHYHGDTVECPRLEK